MKKNLIILIAALALILIGGVIYFSRNKESAPPAPAPETQVPAPSTDEQMVRNVVTQFGEKLQNVSLLAPREALVQQIKDNYGPYASSGLMSAWESNPERAPGRRVSSPWPKRIDILLVESTDDGAYEVQGKVIEVTSVENINENGSAFEYPVAIKLRKYNDSWLITGFTKAIQQ